MAEHNDLGQLGEDLAASYLQEKQYQIMEKNFRFQKAEIDIIAFHKNTLVVVEVKTRTSTAFGLPQDFIKAAKIKLLTKAINFYVESNHLNYNIRFDIIAIHKKTKGIFEIEHIEDAFYHF